MSHWNNEGDLQFFAWLGRASAVDLFASFVTGSSGIFSVDAIDVPTGVISMSCVITLDLTDDGVRYTQKVRISAFCIT